MTILFFKINFGLYHELMAVRQGLLYMAIRTNIEIKLDRRSVWEATAVAKTVSTIRVWLIAYLENN